MRGRGGRRDFFKNRSGNVREFPSLLGTDPDIANGLYSVDVRITR